MLARMSASVFLVALTLALPLGSGCTKKGQLTEVQVPEAGVSLRYDLTPGQEYAGHIRMRSSAQTPMGDVVTSVEFDVALVVTAKQEDGSPLVRATVKGIEVTARLPDGIPAAMAGIDPEAAKALNGIELSFNLSTRGEISNEPEPPEGVPPEIKGMISMITSALTAGLAVRLPEQPLKDGVTWDATSKDLDEEVKAAKNTGTFEGLARNEAGEDIAQISFAATSESERSMGGQSVAIKAEVETEASFSASGGYPVTLERKINNEIVGQMTVMIEIDAEWSKGGTKAVAPASPESAASPEPSNTEVQEITDPCDPDYVGVGECAEGEAEIAESEPAA